MNQQCLFYFYALILYFPHTKFFYRCNDSCQVALDAADYWDTFRTTHNDEATDSEPITFAAQKAASDGYLGTPCNA